MIVAPEADFTLCKLSLYGFLCFLTARKSRRVLENYAVDKVIHYVLP